MVFPDRARRRLEQHGFSLLEMMVVVSIIAILATLAGPRIQVFLATAKQSEAKENLSTIFALEQAYYGENDTYTADVTALGYSVLGNARYTYSASLTASGFLADATAKSTSNIAAGCLAPDRWQMDEQKHLSALQDCARNSGGGCFVAGTLVDTPSGAKAIDSLSIGDEVIALDLATGTEALSQITDTLVRPDVPIVRLSLSNGMTIDTTEEHPFFSIDQAAWVAVRDLAPGETLVARTTEAATFDAVWVRSIAELGRTAVVYNLTVNGLHNYFVSGVLVHNKQVSQNQQSN